ncbi:LCP family protein [Mobilitalea sibirica]|uniref:LCP family protein n=1 Tax=Mobilitalea sibirica TaxID=1462919 RepID=A0A8J7H1Y0_9FIRM|nr:LCP family protein [Mobilitalea sibirica]MBH1940365.1 LCP family protein [Mobilitalea sibirica]
MASKKVKRRKNLTKIILIEACIAILLLIAVMIYNNINKTLDKIPRENSEDKYIEQNEGIGIDGFRNIVIFGVDTRDNSLKKGNTDTIMVVSINKKNKNVKLVSIYRDTFSHIRNIGYSKINAAYAKGGYSTAINTINLNYDLDIKEYVTVNFKALVDIIDLLGGITLDIEKEELKYLNGYVRELNKINGTDVAGLETAGTQTVNGTQATAYARIRYTTGGDFKRTERQRIVLSQIFDKVKSSDLSTINNLIDKVFPQIYTNLSNSEILSLAKDIISYDIVDQTGFPFEKDAHTYKEVSYVFPIDLEDNVVRLHQYLFEKEGYVPSKTVQEYSAYIENVRVQ